MGILAGMKKPIGRRSDFRAFESDALVFPDKKIRADGNLAVSQLPTIKLVAAFKRIKPAGSSHMGIGREGKKHESADKAR